MRSIIALSLMAALSVLAISPLLSQEKIDLNTASAIELQELVGIGQKVAEKIIAERVANGPFSSLADVAKRVEGIPPGTIEMLEGMAVCGQAAVEPPAAVEEPATE